MNISLKLASLNFGKLSLLSNFYSEVFFNCQVLVFDVPKTPFPTDEITFAVYDDDGFLGIDKYVIV